MAKETVKQTVVVTLAVCLVCSVVVSGFAVALKSRQEHNRELDIHKNVLEVVGFYDPGVDIEEAFKKIETGVLDIQSGEWVSEQLLEDTPVTQLTDAQDIAGIHTLPRYRRVYLVYHDGRLDKVALLVYGYGLWSTMYGFLALEGDGMTVYGLKFYDQKETPGLGGEVDNPAWQGLWEGKHLYDNSGKLCIEVIKGKLRPGARNADCKVDGISGATLTSRGVSNLINFWSGDLGYGHFLTKLREGSVKRPPAYSKPDSQGANS